MPLLVRASNDLERLGEQLIARLAGDLRATEPAELFRPQLVLVPTAGLRDWLRQYIASRLGICCGIALCYPGALRELLVERFGLPAAEPAWRPQQARWRCLGLLGGQPALAAYLGAERRLDGKAWQLAAAIVDCFERYALYRPQETLVPWAADRPGPHDHEVPWQGGLWRALLAAGVGDPVADQRALLEAVDERPSALPRRLQVFGFNSLAPGLLELLATIARHRPVEIFTLQPTWGYWGDDQRRLRDLVRDEVPASEWGNRLLGDWGRIGRDFLRALDEVGADYLSDPDDFGAPGRDCLLHRLQEDLSAACSPDEGGWHRLTDDDDSLQVHACHSLRRQLEVAKEAIHRAFAADPELRPQDVALMTPDPEGCAALAAAVFASQSHGAPIAVAVADRSRRRLNPAVEVLLRLLELLPGRFRAGEVIDFIGCAAVAGAWGLGADELARLRGWIETADLRWGVDAEHRRACLGHAYAAGSWHRGLQRLQLAWWYGDDADSARPFLAADEDPGEAVVPVADVQPEDGDCLKRLSLLLQTLLAAAADIRRGLDPRGWQQELARLLRHVLRCRDDDADYAQVLAELGAWCEELEAADWRGPVDVSLVAASFTERFARPAGGDFGRGAVTISGMQPMRSVPFRMLCLVGMDDGAFPREQGDLDFDLLRRHPRAGDRDLRAEDRYLLLELLVSARHRLCITYQGFDARDRSQLPPATMVGELLEVAGRSCGLRPEEARHRLVHVHRLHGCFDEAAVWPDERLRREHRALAGGRRQPLFTSGPLPDEDGPLVIDLEQLVQFWLCPARAWLHRLGAAVPTPSAAPRDHERFTTPLGSDRYHAARRLLASQRQGEELRQRLAAEGWLPPGVLGEEAWHQLDGFTAALRERQHQLLVDCDQHQVSLQGQGFELLARFEAVHPQRGVIRLHPGKANQRQRLDCWIRAVVAAAAGLPARATLCHLDRQEQVAEWRLRIDRAKEQLDLLLDGYRQGLRLPLPFAPRTSHEYHRLRTMRGRAIGRRPALFRCERFWAETPPVASAPPPEAELPAHRTVWPTPDSPVWDPDFPHWAEALWQAIAESEEEEQA